MDALKAMSIYLLATEDCVVTVTEVKLAIKNKDYDKTLIERIDQDSDGDLSAGELHSATNRELIDLYNALVSYDGKNFVGNPYSPTIYHFIDIYRCSRGDVFPREYPLLAPPVAKGWYQDY